MGPTPETPRSRAPQNSSVVLPIGVTAPSPVTTTRRLSTLRPLLVLFDVGDGVSHRGDLLGVLVGDLEVEFLLERHHQLDGVEGVRPEVLDELRVRVDLVLLHPELLTDDLLDPLLHRLGHESLLTSNGLSRERPVVARRPLPTCTGRRCP